jgi:hypothetical protein
MFIYKRIYNYARPEAIVNREVVLLGETAPPAAEKRPGSPLTLGGCLVAITPRS